MLSWTGFAAAAPELAAFARPLFVLDGIDQAFLVTVAGDEAPRVHPIYVGFADDRLYAFVKFAKRHDLETDGRYALHAHMDPAVPNELELRGRVRVVDDPAERAQVAATWSFTTGAEFGLFEFLIETVVVGKRSSANAWPPIYTTWKAP